MEPIGDPEPLRAESPRLAGPERLIDRGLGARDHRLGRTVLGRDVDGEAETPHLVGPGEDRGHPPARDLRHEAPAEPGEGERVLDVDRAGDRGRRDLADRMAEDGRGRHAPRAEELGEGPLERDERGLGDRGVLEALDLGERPPDQRAEGRQGSEEFAPHPGIRGALAGEEEGDAGGHGRIGLAGGGRIPLEGAERNCGFGAVRGDEREAMLEGHAPGVRRVADVGEPRPGVRLEPPGEVRGELAKGARGPRRDREHVERPLGGRGGERGAGRLLEDDVCVRPPEPERADARAPGAVRARPRDRPPRHDRRHGREVEVRVRRLEVEVRREHAVLEREDDLGHARRAGGRLEVAEVGLGRAEDERPGRVARRPEDPGERADLDRVAERGPGPVRLDVVEVGGLEPRVGERRADDRLLRGAAGRGEAARAAVLVDRRAPDDRAHEVAALLRLGEAFEDDEAAALAADHPVGPRVEGPAASGGREHPGLGVGDRRVGGEDEVDPAGEREVALAAAERLAGEVEGDEARRAGRLDDERRADEAEDVGDPRGHDRVVAPGRGIGVEQAAVPRHRQEPRIVGLREADVDAGP